MTPRTTTPVLTPVLPLIPHLLDAMAIIGYLIGGWGVVAVFNAVRFGTPIYAMANENWLASIGVAVIMFVGQQIGKTLRWWHRLERTIKKQDETIALLEKELARYRESEDKLEDEVEKSHEANLKLREQLADTTRKLAAVQPKTPNPD